MFNGYVRLYRDLLSWQWYNNPNVLRLYIHLLLSASFKDFDFEGKFYKAGTVITGRKKLSAQLEMTESQIRTALEKLESTKDIEIKATNKYSVITLLNWDKAAQSPNFFANRSPTNNRQKTNQSPQYNKEKNVKNKNKVNYARGSARKKNSNDITADSNALAIAYERR